MADDKFVLNDVLLDPAEARAVASENIRHGTYIVDDVKVMATGWGHLEPWIVESEERILGLRQDLDASKRTTLDMHRQVMEALASHEEAQAELRIRLDKYAKMFESMPMEVERFSMNGDDLCQESDGDFVRSEDYDALMSKSKPICATIQAMATLVRAAGIKDFQLIVSEESFKELCSEIGGEQQGIHHAEVMTCNGRTIVREPSQGRMLTYCSLAERHFLDTVKKYGLGPGVGECQEAYTQVADES